MARQQRRAGAASRLTYSTAAGAVSANQGASAVRPRTDEDNNDDRENVRQRPDTAYVIPHQAQLTAALEENPIMRGIFHVLTNQISDQLARSIAEQKENTNKLVKAINDMTGVMQAQVATQCIDTAAVKEAVGNIMKYQTFYPSDTLLREAVASLHGYPDYSALLRASPMLVAATLRQNKEAARKLIRSPTARAAFSAFVECMKGDSSPFTNGGDWDQQKATRLLDGDLFRTGGQEDYLGCTDFREALVTVFKPQGRDADVDNIAHVSAPQLAFVIIVAETWLQGRTVMPSDGEELALVRIIYDTRLQTLRDPAWHSAHLTLHLPAAEAESAA